jgi:hypothetical protein
MCGAEEKWKGLPQVQKSLECELILGPVSRRAILVQQFICGCEFWHVLILYTAQFKDESKVIPLGKTCKLGSIAKPYVNHLGDVRALEELDKFPQALLSAPDGAQRLHMPQVNRAICGAG